MYCEWKINEEVVVCLITYNPIHLMIPPIPLKIVLNTQNKLTVQLNPIIVPLQGLKEECQLIQFTGLLKRRLKLLKISLQNSDDRGEDDEAEHEFDQDEASLGSRFGVVVAKAYGTEGC